MQTGLGGFISTLFSRFNFQLSSKRKKNLVRSCFMSCKCWTHLIKSWLIFVDWHNSFFIICSSDNFCLFYLFIYKVAFVFEHIFSPVFDGGRPELFIHLSNIIALQVRKWINLIMYNRKKNLRSIKTVISETDFIVLSLLRTVNTLARSVSLESWKKKQRGREREREEKVEKIKYFNILLRLT